MIKDKVVVITGASSGIGEETAKMLASHGAKVVLGARRNDRLEKISADINDNGGEAIYLETDVTKSQDVQNLIDQAIDKFGGLDVVFNNAGIMPNSPISALKVNDWDAMIDVNLKGVLNGIAAAMPIFTKQKSGQIITTSSIARIKSFMGAGVYEATKFAVRNIMEVLRMESASEGTNIRTSTLYPAAINTELTDHIIDSKTKEGVDKLYAAVGILPDAVARVVDFAIDQPEGVNINEFTIYPLNQV